MHKFIRTGLIGLAATVGIMASTAHAGEVVDTGAPTPDGFNWSLYNNGNGEFQALAARFVLGGATTITGVQGFIGGSGGTFHIGIASDGVGIPNNTLFTGQATAAASSGDWAGLSNLNWALGPGAYWIFFNVDANAGDTLVGYMPDLPPNPLLDEAFINELTGGDWAEYDDLDLGVRIYDNRLGAVPEPATWLFMLAGFGIVGAAMRRRPASTRVTVSYS